jgi:hypothetical protein
MTMQYRDEHDEKLDEVVRTRLRRLQAMPVDVTELERKLVAHLPNRISKEDVTGAWSLRHLVLQPRRALAASFLLSILIAGVILLTTSSGPALAEASTLAQVHEEIVSGKIPVTQVSSIDAANLTLRDEHPGTPSLPQIPDSHVMACCMKSVQNKKMACVLLKHDGIAVTLAVASAADMKMPAGTKAIRNGTRYLVQKTGNLSMVMTERNGKWLCLIGATSSDELMDIASEIRF